MARTQLQQALARPDPMLTFQWEVKTVPGGDVYFGNNPASYIESFDVPFSNVKTTGVFFGGGYNYFPEFHDTSAFSVTFYGDSEGRALAYLWDWKQQVKDFSTGLYGLPAGANGFKKDWVVLLNDSKGVALATITFAGCWPADTNNITLDQEGSSRITLAQTFSVDSMSIVLKNYPKAGDWPKNPKS
jgi:hypothetical protein